MPVVSYRYRLKDRSAKKTLVRHAYGVNQVFNYLNARQKDIEARYRSGAPKRRWGSHFDLQKLVKGIGAEFGIHQQTVGGVCKAFAKARDNTKHSLRFRSSFGPRRAPGWVPFEKQSRQIDGNSVTYLGKTYRFFGSTRRPLPENAKGGAFVEDALGRWWVVFHVEVEGHVGDSASGDAFRGEATEGPSSEVGHHANSSTFAAAPPASAGLLVGSTGVAPSSRPRIDAFSSIRPMVAACSARRRFVVEVVVAIR